MGAGIRAGLLWLSALAPAAVGQFGGAGGGGGWTPPPPVCPSFTCPAKQRPVSKEGAKVWAYGCKESGVSFLNTASFNPNDPLSGLKSQNNVDKCCVEKEICIRTCGMTAVACHEHFQKCSKKICKADQNCNMMAQLADMMSQPLEDEKLGADAGPDGRKCAVYNQAQREACECAPKDEWQGHVESRLTDFYKKYNPEKLDKSGKIKDTKSIWKTWKGKEPEMFFELTKKYRKEAVEIRVKPKPKYDKYDNKDFGESTASGASASEEEADSVGADSGGTTDGVDADGAQKAEAPGASTEEPAEADDGGFSLKARDLEARKERAKEDEDYDLASQLKDELMELKRAEIKRLSSEKTAAIAAEDFLKAKQLKAKIKQLDPKSEL